MRQLKGLIRLVKGGGLFGCSPASRERESEKAGWRGGRAEGRRRKRKRAIPEDEGDEY